MTRPRKPKARHWTLKGRGGGFSRRATKTRQVCLAGKSQDEMDDYAARGMSLSRGNETRASSASREGGEGTKPNQGERGKKGWPRTPPSRKPREKPGANEGRKGGSPKGEMKQTGTGGGAGEKEGRGGVLSLCRAIANEAGLARKMQGEVLPSKSWGED